MRRKNFKVSAFLVFLAIAAALFAPCSHAQEEQPALPAPEQKMIELPIVKLRSLDKVTARTMTFEANVGATVKFGDLYIKAQVCRKSTPLEDPEAASFLQIWEVDKQEKPHWVFSGWMFASSPGLSSMDHPIYDVWVLDCLEKKGEKTEEDKAAEKQRGEGEVAADQVPAVPAIESGGQQ